MENAYLIFACIVPIEMRFSFLSFFVAVFCSKNCIFRYQTDSSLASNFAWTPAGRTIAHVTFECVAAHSENKMRFAKLQFYAHLHQNGDTRYDAARARNFTFIWKCGRHKSLEIQANLFDFKAACHFRCISGKWQYFFASKTNGCWVRLCVSVWEA